MVRLPNELLRSLRDEARRQHTSVAAVIRQALDPLLREIREEEAEEDKHLTDLSDEELQERCYDRGLRPVIPFARLEAHARNRRVSVEALIRAFLIDCLTRKRAP
jgi:hypothetical protein